MESIDIEKHIEKLTPSAKKYLGKSDQERIRKIEGKKWLPYPQAQLVLDELEHLFNYPKRDRMPNLLIVGNTNNGKTSILNKFMERHPTYPTAKCTVVPIIHFQAPISPSHNALYEKILDFLKVPYGVNDSASQKEYQVLHILKEIQTRMIVIDEFQDIFNGKVGEQKKFLAGVKHLGNELKIPIVAAGVWEVQRVIASDPQMANRFDTIKLGRWGMDDEFKKLVKGFERTLPLEKPSNLHRNETVTFLYEKCEGILGDLDVLLQRAAGAAISSGKEKIDMDVLRSIRFVPSSKRRAGDRKEE